VTSELYLELLHIRRMGLTTEGCEDPWQGLLLLAKRHVPPSAQPRISHSARISGLFRAMVRISLEKKKLNLDF
jgi:hypothetical protein